MQQVQSSELDATVKQEAFFDTDFVNYYFHPYSILFDGAYC